MANLLGDNPWSSDTARCFTQFQLLPPSPIRSESNDAEKIFDLMIQFVADSHELESLLERELQVLSRDAGPKDSILFTKESDLSVSSGGEKVQKEMKYQIKMMGASCFHESRKRSNEKAPINWNRPRNS